MKNLYLLGAMLLICFGCSKNKDVTSTTTSQQQSTKIKTFSIAEFYPSDANIDSIAKTITFDVPPGVDPTRLTPNITCSPGATVSPASDSSQNFSNPISYTVKSGTNTTTYIATANFISADSKSTPVAPKALCIYYGIPSMINGSTTISSAITQFSQFDLIVLGNGLEASAHPDHSNTISIINGLSGKKIYGYISVNGLSESQFRAKVEKWKTMNVTGIFLDEFDIISRSIQNSYIQYVHSRYLSCFANGSAYAVLGGTDPATELTAGDYFLLESYLISHGSYTGAGAYKSDGDLAYKMMRTKKIGIAAVSSVADNSIYLSPTSNTSNDFKYAWCGVAMYNFDAFQFTEGNYSATYSRVYYYPNLFTSYGSYWIDRDWIKQNSSGIFSRSTGSSKIWINTSTHTGNID